MFDVINITGLLILDFNKCNKNCKKHGHYFTMLLTGDL